MCFCRLHFWFSLWRPHPPAGGAFAMVGPGATLRPSADGYDIRSCQRWYVPCLSVGFDRRLGVRAAAILLAKVWHLWPHGSTHPPPYIWCTPDPLGPVVNRGMGFSTSFFSLGFQMHLPVVEPCCGFIASVSLYCLFTTSLGCCFLRLVAEFGCRTLFFWSRCGMKKQRLLLMVFVHNEEHEYAHVCS